MSGIKKKTLSLKEKIQLIRDSEEKSKSELCRKYGCSISSVNRIIQNKRNILDTAKSTKLSSKRKRTGALVDVEHALLVWFNQMRESGAAVSSQMVIEKSKQFAIQMNKDFNPSAGWLHRWQKREGIQLRKIHGEAASANEGNANEYVSEILPELISSYDASQIFNADESGLFFRALPKTTLNRKGCQVKGYKTSKDRLTLLFICNASGDYKKVVVIGKPKNPRCFRNKTLPLKYYSQNKAWMTKAIWENVLISLNKDMKSQNRNIILFVDNAACHKVDIVLTNVIVEFLPANTTSRIQPLDQGIIHCFKSYYRQNIIRKQISHVERGQSLETFSKTINILTAMHMIRHSWWLVQPLTLTNCFAKVN